MELLTTVRDFMKEVRYHQIAPDTHIRIIIYDSKTGWEPIHPSYNMVPVISPEEQRRQLNLIPTDYDPDASKELIRLIETSHLNTDTLEL